MLRPSQEGLGWRLGAALLGAEEDLSQPSPCLLSLLFFLLLPLLRHCLLGPLSSASSVLVAGRPRASFSTPRGRGRERQGARLLRLQQRHLSQTRPLAQLMPPNLAWKRAGQRSRGGHPARPVRATGRAHGRRMPSAARVPPTTRVPRPAGSERGARCPCAPTRTRQGRTRHVPTARWL